MEPPVRVDREQAGSAHWIGTHLQQFGGWSDGVCPAGQAAQRTFEQSVTVVSTGTHLQQSGGLSGGKILGANSETCLEIRDRGIMWMHDADSRRGQELALWSVLAAANYNYIIEWRFRDDGVISSRIGATGAPAGGDTHVHGPLWRLDIDLNGACCDTVTHMSHKEMGLTGVDSMADLNNATGLKWDPVAYDTLHIRDAVLKNGNGKPSMWMFMPERSGTPVHQEPFTQMVFWVTPYVWNQTDGAQLPSYVANRPNTANTDTVVWYYGGLHHVIRDEDNAPDGWSQMTLTMYEGVHLMPFNLWSSTPFYP